MYLLEMYVSLRFSRPKETVLQTPPCKGTNGLQVHILVVRGRPHRFWESAASRSTDCINARSTDFVSSRCISNNDVHLRKKVRKFMRLATLCSALPYAHYQSRCSAVLSAFLSISAGPWHSLFASTSMILYQGQCGLPCTLHCW
jgi:hypothetical protein